MISLGIADDEPDILKLFKIMLSMKGYPVSYFASNGEEAVEMNRKKPADIVILDHVMPFKNGIDAAKEILGEYPKTKILLMTCGEDLGEKINALGDVTIIKKPFSFKSIIPMLDA
jgi:two-component system, chemotaxis family, chemotaxis protein CheY